MSFVYIGMSLLNIQSVRAFEVGGIMAGHHLFVFVYTELHPIFSYFVLLYCTKHCYIQMEINKYDLI